MNSDLHESSRGRKKRERLQAVLEYIENNQGPTRDEIAEALNQTPTTIYNCLKELEFNHEIISKKRKKNGRLSLSGYFRYDVQKITQVSDIRKKIRKDYEFLLEYLQNRGVQGATMCQMLENSVIKYRQARKKLDFLEDYGIIECIKVGDYQHYFLPNYLEVAKEKHKNEILKYLGKQEVKGATNRSINSILSCKKELMQYFISYLETERTISTILICRTKKYYLPAYKEQVLSVLAEIQANSEVTVSNRRLSIKELLTNYHRREIYTLLKQKGMDGAFFKEIEQTTSCGKTAIYWHLDILEDYGVVSQSRDIKGKKLYLLAKFRKGKKYEHKYQKKEQLPDNKYRTKILEYLEKKGEKGAYRSEIIQTIIADQSVIDHHLKMLIKNQYIRQSRIGGFSVFFLVKYQADIEAHKTLVLKSKVAKEIYGIIMAKNKSKKKQYITPSELYRSVPYHQKTVDYHLRKFSESGILSPLPNTRPRKYLIQTTKRERL